MLQLSLEEKKLIISSVYAQAVEFQTRERMYQEGCDGDTAIKLHSIVAKLRQEYDL